MEEKQWFLYVVDHHEGPYTREELNNLIQKGQAQQTSYIWKEGMADWMMMSDTPEFGGTAPKTDGHGQPSFVISDLQASGSDPSFSSAPFGSSQYGESGQKPSSSGVPATDEVWCLCSKDKYSGPHAMKDIVAEVKNKTLTIHDLVWREGWTSFMPISQLSDVMGMIHAANASSVSVAKSQTLVISKKKLLSGKSMALSSVIALILGGGAAIHFGLVPNPIDAKNLGKLPSVPGLNIKENIQAKIAQIRQTLSVYAPEQIKPFLSVVKIPDGVDSADQSRLQEAANAPLKDGVKLEFSLLNKNNFNPVFVFATNAPNGTRFAFVLKSLPDALIGASSFERVLQFEVKNGIGETARISYDQNRALPQGEYGIFITEADSQSSDVNEKLTMVPKVNVPGLKPSQRAFFLNQNVFLGGTKDAVYLEKIKEQKAKQQEKLKLEVAEVSQLVNTIESVANDGANLFFDLSQIKKLTSKHKKQWADLVSSHKKILDQIKASLDRTPSERLRADLYNLTSELYTLTMQLSGLESDYLEQAFKSTAASSLENKMGEIKGLASGLSHKLANAKESVKGS